MSSSGETPAAETAAAEAGAADSAAQTPGEQAPDPALVERIAARAHAIARHRLRQTLQEQTGVRARAPVDRHASELDDELLDRIADEEADRADGPLLRVSVAEAAAEELGVPPAAALAHPAAARARELLRDSALREAAPGGARPRPTAPPAVLVEAVHVFGIETVQPGDRDIELRLADAGIDVRRPSTGNTIGRLRWTEVRSVVVRRPRRGTGGLRRPAQLLAGTNRGEVTFDLVGLSDEDITDHLEPLIARNCESFHGAIAS